jgi:hypothetical protein
MALENRKSSCVFFTWKETKTGQENNPNNYKVNGCRFEGCGTMTLPAPTRVMESDKGKLGAGEHGKKAQLMTVATPWSYKTNRPGEIGFLLNFFMGKADTYATNSHTLYHLKAGSLELPTFGFQFGNGLSNKVYAGAVVNEFNLTFPFQGGNGQIEATFSGWANAHYVSADVITVLPAGTFAIGSGHESTFAEPIVNVKSTSVWLADTLEASFGATSINSGAEDLGANLIDITALINSLTISGNNGMSMEDKLRAGGCGIINDWTRGVRSISCELNCRKDTTVINWDTIATARTQKTLEVEWNGPVLSATVYLIDLFIPVFEVNTCVEDDATPVSQAVTTEVFQDSEGEALIARVNSSTAHTYDALNP